MITIERDPLEVVRALKAEDGMDIWLCGGANLAGQLLPEIDELHVKINPVVFGDGTRLVETDFSPMVLSLRSVRTLAGDVLLATYRVSAATPDTSSPTEPERN